MAGSGLHGLDDYAERLGAAPLLSSTPLGRPAGVLRRWSGTPTRIDQPPVTHHYLVLHLGGPKTVTRSGGGRELRVAVAEGALSLVPAGTSNGWSTEGPIDFAHLYVHPSHFLETALRQGASPRLAPREALGFRDPLLERTLGEMLELAALPGAGAYMTALLDVVVNRLVRAHSVVSAHTPAHRPSLAPARLRRVLAFIDANLGERISLDDMAAAGGLSRSHFGRAFRGSVGEAPYAHLVSRRVEMAEGLLRSSTLPIAEVGRRCGLGGASAFAEVFRSRTGRSPWRCRRDG